MKKKRYFLYLFGISLLFGGVAFFLLFRSNFTDEPISSTDLTLGVLSALSSLASLIKGVLDLMPKNRSKLHTKSNTPALQKMVKSPDGKQFREDDHGGSQIMIGSKGGQQKISKPRDKK